MRIRVTWDGSAEGSERILLLRSQRLRLWACVESPDGTSPAARVEITAALRPTKNGWLFAKFPLLGWVLGSLPQRPRVEPSPLDGRSFAIHELPDHTIPYWLDVSATIDGAPLDQASIYVVPRTNRFLSFPLLLLAALTAAYASWLVFSLSSERVPNGLATLGTTAVGIATPLLAVAGPFFSQTIRRLAWDASISFLLLAGGLLLASGFRFVQKPVYFENVASASVDLHKQVILDAGGAAVLPMADLEPALKSYLACTRLPASPTSAECKLPSNFQAANLCVLGPEDDSCLEIRSPNWTAKLQRWMSLGETVRIGCRSVSDLLPKYLDAWKGSGSCKRDPELKVTETLRDHVLSISKGAPATICVEPRAEVDVRPFRGSTASGTDLTLRKLELHWPESIQGSLPSWRFTGNGRVSEVRLSPAVPADIPCPQIDGKAARLAPYGEFCDKDHNDCAVLYAPPGQLSATLERGEQKLGTLWCAADANHIFAVRLRSRLTAFRILSNDEDVVSKYEALAAGLGEWVFWCEPQSTPSDGRTLPPRRLSAEATLASDWQPDNKWTWTIPEQSAVRKLTINVTEHGQWGALSCGVDLRHLNLLRGDLGAEEAFVKATLPGLPGQRGADAKSATSEWVRYSETDLYPAWVWFCSKAADPPLNGQPLEVVTRRASGELNAAGRFTPSPGVPCLIDPTTKTVERDRPRPDHAKCPSAASTLKLWPQPRCDRNRSYLHIVGEGCPQ
jgi:hypothetical protein